MSRFLDVVRSGALTTVQDAGRSGWGHLAVPRSGALDGPAHRLANRLVGNPEDAAVLETTMSGVAFRVSADCHVAVTGAWAEVRVDERATGWALPVWVPAGALIDIGEAIHGVRCYVAVSGGVTVAPVLGSRSTDLLSGLGPPVLRDGDRLPVGEPMNPPAGIDMAPYPAPADECLLRILLGPRDDWITPASLAQLGRASYLVAPASNRIGLRLDGPALQWRTDTELPSEGTVTGAVQVPPDGKPLIFLADHPTTGGYPVIAVVHPEDLSRCAQARPGTTIRFKNSRAAEL